jgi:hypothetical protein
MEHSQRFIPEPAEFLSHLQASGIENMSDDKKD